MNISSSVGLFFFTTVTPTGGLPKPGLAALPVRAGPSSPDSKGPDAEDNLSCVCGRGFTAAAERWPLAEFARPSDVFWALGPLGASGGGSALFRFPSVTRDNAPEPLLIPSVKPVDCRELLTTGALAACSLSCFAASLSRARSFSLPNSTSCLLTLSFSCALSLCFGSSWQPSLR
jgi:hypothetical protein